MIQFGLFLPATFLFLRFPFRKGIAYGKVRMKHQCGVEAIALTILEAFDKRGTSFGHQLNDLLIGQYLASLVAKQGEVTIDIGTFGDLIKEQDAAFSALGTSTLFP